jgi:hypothetical protein
LNQNNPDDPAARSAFYGISSTATAFFNGLLPLNTKLGAGQLNVLVDSLSLKESLFDLKLGATNGTTPSKLNLTLLIEAKENFNSPLLANVGLVDNEIPYGIGAGANKLRNVLRKLLLGGDGRLINQSWTKGQTLLISVKDVAQIIELISSGELTDKLARQVVEGVIAGEGSPSEVITKRGLKVVSDDSQLMSAIEAAIAAAPETAERVRGGNIPAAGALIGAVMKSTGGQADAAKVRELLLKHLGQ